MCIAFRDETQKSEIINYSAYSLRKNYKQIKTVFLYDYDKILYLFIYP